MFETVYQKILNSNHNIGLTQGHFRKKGIQDNL